MIDHTDRGNGNDTPFCDMLYRWALLLNDGLVGLNDLPHLSFELADDLLVDDTWYIDMALKDPHAGYIIVPKFWPLND